MNKAEVNLDRLHVASPCSANWEAMQGGDQVRFCHQCSRSRLAGAALSAVLSLMPSGFSQAYQAKRELKADGGTYTIVRRTVDDRAKRFKPAFVEGTVYDINKAIVVNARVTLTNEQTKEKRTVNTNGEGLYSFSGVEANTYTITVVSPGFRTFRQGKLSLKANEQVELDATLEVATIGEIVIIDRDKEVKAGKSKPGKQIN